MITFIGIKAIIDDIRDGNFDILLSMLFILTLPIILGIDMLFFAIIIQLWIDFIKIFI